MHLEKKLFQSNKYGHMDVDQNKFKSPIIITALVLGHPFTIFFVVLNSRYYGSFFHIDGKEETSRFPRFISASAFIFDLCYSGKLHLN
jgi:hypothetical protein